MVSPPERVPYDRFNCISFKVPHNQQKRLRNDMLRTTDALNSCTEVIKSYPWLAILITNGLKRDEIRKMSIFVSLIMRSQN